MPVEFGNWVLSKPEFPKLFKSFGYPRRHHTQQTRTQSKTAIYQQHTAIINNNSLTVIFLFKLKNQVETPFFNGATLNVKSITVMYTDVKINGQPIKLILNSGSTGSIIM
ncbi:hypothetical protein G9A89_002800 [Geosiphon pyriformis]|nr:hypothetical protein G9A89_002800 [Geosiphon pyriformis]